jgi:hypothetical protein
VDPRPQPPLPLRRRGEQLHSSSAFTYRPGGTKHRSTSSRGEGDGPNAERSAVVEGLLDLLEGERVRVGGDGQRVMPDLGLLAERWLALIHPVWEAVRKETRSKILLLRHLRGYLRRHPPTTEALDQLLRQDGLWVQPLDERVVAAIVGVVVYTSDG